MYDDATSGREAMPALEELNELAGTDSSEDMAELEGIIAQQETTAYALFGAAALGLIGAILAFIGMGTVAAILLLVSGIAPFAVRPDPVIFVFTGALILAGIISFFAKKTRKTPEPPVEATPA
jgi:hypothetical protein